MLDIYLKYIDMYFYVINYYSICDLTKTSKLFFNPKFNFKFMEFLYNRTETILVSPLDQLMSYFTSILLLFILCRLTFIVDTNVIKIIGNLHRKTFVRSSDKKNIHCYKKKNSLFIVHSIC